MSNIIIYDKETGKVKSYRESVNTPDYPDALKVSERPAVDLKFLKVEKGKLVELDASEKSAVLAAEQKERDDADKAFTDKIDAIKDIEGLKTYLKENRLYA